MSNTPITDYLRTRMSAGNLDLDDLFDTHEKLELAANELHSRLSIRVKEVNDIRHINIKDIEALVGLSSLTGYKS